jgi:hypothetical protein
VAGRKKIQSLHSHPQMGRPHLLLHSFLSLCVCVWGTNPHVDQIKEDKTRQITDGVETFAVRY